MRMLQVGWSRLFAERCVGYESNLDSFKSNLYGWSRVLHPSIYVLRSCDNIT